MSRYVYCRHAGPCPFSCPCECHTEKPARVTWFNCPKCHELLDLLRYVRTQGPNGITKTATFHCKGCGTNQAQQILIPADRNFVPLSVGYVEPPTPIKD